MSEKSEVNGLFTVYVPPEVKPFETAARIYMAKCGDNPDDNVPQGHPTLDGVVVHVPVWCFAAKDMIDLAFKLQAMKEAAAAGPLVLKS